MNSYSQNLLDLELPFQRQLPNLLTYGQLTPEDMAKLAACGVKSIVFNRPDAEETDQPSLANLMQAAEAAGIEFYHQPVISGQVTFAEGKEFARICAELPKPLVAFCRTGARCGCLWALSKSEQQTAQELIAQLEVAGFAMPDFFAQLTQLQAN